jgi:hypothetical protein
MLNPPEIKVVATALVALLCLGLVQNCQRTYSITEIPEEERIREVKFKKTRTAQFPD